MDKPPSSALRGKRNGCVFALVLLPPAQQATEETTNGVLIQVGISDALGKLATDLAA